MRRLLTRFLRRQEGIAMPVVIGTLTITTGLAAGTFAVVVEGNHASVRDRDSKAALAAAEAGLQLAILRTTQLKPAATQCVTNALVVPGSASNDGSSTAATECPRWKESIGNGATFTYVVATPTSGTCPTLPGFTATPGKDRCITSIGEVNGVRRRIQLRFYFNPPFVPWGNAGLVGKDLVDLGNNAEIRSPVGTNGEVVAGNNTDIIGELLLPPGAHYDFGQHSGSTGGVRTPRVDKWTFPEIDWATPRTENNNVSALTAIPGYNSTTRILTLGQQQQVTLPGGTYHLCGVQATNGNWLNVTNGQVVRLYIDSPRGNPDYCPAVAGAGRFTAKNSGMFNATDDKNPAELEVYVYGTTADADEPSGSADVDINNGVEFYGTIWAPNSTIDVKNNQGIAGGFTGGKVHMKNNGGFAWDARVANKSLPGTATARNLSWFECKRDPTTTTDPESGCS